MKGFEDAAQAHNDASRINRALSLARSRKPEADARAAPPVRYYPPAKACFYNEAPEATREVVEDSESFTRDGSWSTESFMRDSMAAEFFATMRSGKSAVGLWSDAKGRANGQQFPRVNLTNNQLITGDGLLGANSAERCSSRTSNTEAKGGVPRMTPINSATTTALSPPRSLSTARVAAGTGKGTRFSGSSLGSSTGQQNITAGNSKGGGRRSQRVTASAYDSYATLVKPSSPPSLEKSTAVPGLIDIDADLVHIHYNNYVNTSTIVEGLQDRGADSSESFRASIFSRGSTRSQMPEGEKTPDFITLASLRMRLIKRKENEERAMAASDDGTETPGPAEGAQARSVSVGDAQRVNKIDGRILPARESNRFSIRQEYIQRNSSGSPAAKNSESTVVPEQSPNAKTKAAPRSSTAGVLPERAVSRRSLRRAKNEEATTAEDSDVQTTPRQISAGAPTERADRRVSVSVRTGGVATKLSTTSVESNSKRTPLMKPKAGVLPKRTSIGGSVRGAHAAPRTAPDSNAGTPRTRTAPRSSRGIVLPNRPSERGRVPKNGKVNRTGGANVLDRDAFERRQKDRSSGADVLDRDSLARLLMDSQKDGNAGNLHNNSMRREVDRAMSTDVLDAEGIARLLKNARENVDDGEQGLDSGGAGVPRTSAAQDVAIASRANDRMSEADSLNETSLRRLLDQDNTSSAKGLLDALSMARFHERDQRSTLKPRRPSLSNKLDEALRDGDEDARAGDSEVVLQEQVQQEEHGIGRDESDEPYLRPMGPKRTPTAARTRRKEIRKATPSARPGVEKDKEDEPWTDEELDREVVAYEFGGKRVTNVVELFQVLRPKQPQLDYSALAEGPLFGRFAAYFMPVSTPSKVFNFVVLNAPAYLRPVTRKKIRQRRILREEKKREEQRRLETMRAKSPDASLEQDELDSVLSSDTERARNHADLPPRLQIFSRGQSKEGEALSVDAFISADEDVPDDLSNKKSIVKLLDHAKAKVGSFRPAYSGEDVRQRDMLRRDAYLRQFLEAGGTPDRPLFDTRPVNINKVMLRRCGVTQPEDDEEYSETDEHGLHPKRLRRILMERYLQDVESRTKKRASIALLNREELVSMNKATSNPEFWENWRARQDAVSPTATFRGLVEQYSPLTVPGATGRSPPTSAALFRLRSKIEGSSSARVGQFLNSAPSGGVSAYDEMQRSTKGEQVQRHRLCGHLAGLFEAAPPAQLDADINAQSDSFQHSAWPLEEQAQVLQRGHLEQLKQLALREEKDRVTHAINVAAAGVKSTVMKGMAKEAGVGEDALPETASSLKNNGGANTSATASAIGPTASSPTATEGAIGQSSKWNPIATFNMHLRGSESQEFAGRPGTAWGVSCICEHPILADTVIAGTTTGGWKILHWNEEEVEEDEDTYDDADISAFVGEGMNSSGKSAKGSGWFSWLFYGEREEGGNNAMNNQIDPSLKLSAPFLGESMIFPSTHMDGQSGSLKGDGQSSLHLESFRRWGSFLRYREKQAELKQLTASRGAGFQAAVADPGPSKIGEQLKCPDAHPGGHMVTDLTMHRRCRRLLTVGSDHYYRVWDLEEPDLLPLVQSYANPVRTNSVAAHDFSDFVAAGDSDHVVRIWDLNRGFCAYAPAQVMRGHIASVRHVEFEPFGNGVLTASKDGSAAVFDLRSGLCVQLWDGLRYSVISPHDKKARFANGAGGAAKGVGYSGGPLNSAHFSPDLTSVLTVGEYGVCRLYDRRQTRRELFRFASKSGVAKRACFDSTGKTIAICCPQSVFLLDVDKQEYLHGITPRSELRSSADSVPLFTSALFTRENRNLAVASLNCGLTIFEKEAR